MSTRRSFIVQTAAAGVFLANVPVAGGATDPPTVPLGTYRIPNTDLSVSRIAFGADVLRPDRDGLRLFQTVYENGITFFDHADFYGEAAFGEVLGRSPGFRDKIIIQSKCGLRTGENKQVYRDCSQDHIVSAVESSLQLMHTDYLDILLLHWPDALMEPEEVSRAFDNLKRSGKVRYFGVSNHTPSQIELLKKYVDLPLVANQIYLSLESSHLFLGGIEARSTAGALDYCHLHNMQVQAWSPLRGGLLKPPADATPELIHGADVLAAMARKKDVPPSALALAWLLRHPAGIVPIMSSSKPEHVIENCAAERVDLSRQEWYALLDATRPIHSRLAG